MSFARVKTVSGGRSHASQAALCLLLALMLSWAIPSVLMAQDAGSNNKEGRPSPIDELIALYEKAMTEISALKLEVGQLTLQLNKITRERDELKLFIQNNDNYGSDFEKYAISKEEQAQAEAAAKALEARAKRDEKKRRLQAEREQRIAARENGSSGNTGGSANDPFAERAKVLQRAGYRRIGDFVFVGQMGYVYKSETETEYRYSPFFQGWYTDEHKDIDYTRMTLSGTVVHASDGLHDLSIAIAFYDSQKGQVGQTTIRVDGARPGVPYPFTSELQMAADVPFADYTAWVLYSDETTPGPAIAIDPQTDPANGNGSGNVGGGNREGGGDAEGSTSDNGTDDTQKSGDHG